MAMSLSSRLAALVPALVIWNACASSERTTAPNTGPEFAISDAVHEGGTPGFYFLPPMVSQPTFSGTFDADISTLKPQMAFCDVTNGPDTNCGGAGGTPAVIVFTTTSTPPITVDLTTPQYQVNWNTQGAGFSANHTYRVHVTAGASGARRELGFADVLLTTTPGQAKFLQTGDIIAMQDGRTLPIHLRIETGIPGSLAVSAATASVTSGGTDLITATAEDLHGALLAGATVAWSVTTTPATGVADATQPLTPTSGQTSGAGTTTAAFKAGTESGTAIVTAVSSGLSATVTVSTSCDCWTATASMPTARYGPGAGVVNNVLYVVGGLNGSPFNGTGPLSVVEAYDPATGVWSTKAPLPTATAGLGVGVVNGVLYAVGGFNSNPFPWVATLEAYDPATDTWTIRTPMPTARQEMGIGVVNGILYAVGGFVNGTVLSTVEAFDPTTNTWTTKAAMPTPRVGVGVAVVNGILYAMGGETTAAGDVVGTVEAYDPKTDTWTTKAPMLTAQDLPAVGVVNGVVYVAGGWTFNHASVLGTLEAYDPATDSWTPKATMPTARSGPAGGVVNGVFYAMGGFRFDGGGVVVSTVESFTP